MKKWALFSILVLLAGLAVITVMVELEGAYQQESLGGEGPAKALVLFHPSRDARFSDELSLALSDGLKEAGFSVERATLTQDTPGAPKEYALIAVVSNTYWWTPDLPTLHYLARARLDGIAAIGLIGGAGATGRSRQMLDDALRQTGAKVIQTRSFWLFRPNDETRMSEDNRAVARELAKRFGLETGRSQH
jgi:hypothetical protein